MFNAFAKKNCSEHLFHLQAMALSYCGKLNYIPNLIKKINVTDMAEISLWKYWKVGVKKIMIELQVS